MLSLLLLQRVNRSNSSSRSSNSNSSSRSSNSNSYNRSSNSYSRGITTTTTATATGTSTSFVRCSIAKLKQQSTAAAVPAAAIPVASAPSPLTSSDSNSNSKGQSIYENSIQQQQLCVEVKGWIRGIRQQKETTFLDINDGSSVSALQVVIPTSELSTDISYGCSVRVVGNVVTSAGTKQQVELKPITIEVIGKCNSKEYPLQLKHHPTLDSLREILHIRPRTNFFGSVMRIRNGLSVALHSFLQEEGFIHVHSPIITSNDCEGGGQAFSVNSDTKAKGEYFGQPAFLTVSGQLHAEMMACALSRVYTFGPTFRVEGTDTPRHLSEFLMLEPEIAFCDLEGCMDITEKMVKSSIQTILDKCPEDLDFFNKRVDNQVIQRLTSTVKSKFKRIEYREAVKLLENAQQSGHDFKFPIMFGLDLHREHERYLCETYFKQPVFVINWPKEIKPFYMRQNEDGETVAAMDLLVPGIGEIAGGSAREERFSELETAMKKHNLLDNQQYNWYLDLRRFGTVPHAGFGLGFERFIQYVTGVENIKDTIPVPRVPGSCYL